MARRICRTKKGRFKSCGGRKRKSSSRKRKSKSSSCRYGKVKSGPRKGRCRKRRVSRRRR